MSYKSLFEQDETYTTADGERISPISGSALFESALTVRKPDLVEGKRTHTFEYKTSKISMADIVTQYKLPKSF